MFVLSADEAVVGEAVGGETAEGEAVGWEPLDIIDPATSIITHGVCTTFILQLH